MIFENKVIFDLIQQGSFFVDQKTKNPISVKNCIFLDCETVSGYEKFESMPPFLQERWRNKVDNWIQYSESSKAKILDAVFTEFENSAEKDFDQNLLYNIYKKYRTSNAELKYREVAGLYPEYGKIICISMGFVKNDVFQKVSFVGEEKHLLTNFQFGILKAYQRMQTTGDVYVVGHNISFFDIPYITKRMNINGLLVPPFLHQAFLQPWNKKIIDTASEWRVGNTTGDATLDTICAVLGIESPKHGVVDGVNMSNYYYSEECDINEIVTYCEKDIETVFKLFTKLQTLKVHV